MADLNLRPIVDEITLHISEVHSPKSLEAAISDGALSHIRAMIDAGTLTDPDEIDRVTQAIVKGVLRRLLQIAESGGQIGKA